MSIHRECPESPSASYIVLDLSLKKNNNFNTKSDQNIH